MPCFHSADIINELVSLSIELIDEVYQELNYYHASVYKKEAEARIDEKLTNLRLVCDLLGNDTLSDFFRDYDVSKSSNHSDLVPGISPFSTRITTLTGSVRSCIQHLTTQHILKDTKENLPEYSKRIKKYRQNLLSICRRDSRHWAFFHSL